MSGMNTETLEKVLNQLMLSGITDVWSMDDVQFVNVENIIANRIVDFGRDVIKYSADPSSLAHASMNITQYSAALHTLRRINESPEIEIWYYHREDGQHEQVRTLMRFKLFQYWDPNEEFAYNLRASDKGMSFMEQFILDRVDDWRKHTDENEIWWYVIGNAPVGGAVPIAFETEAERVEKIDAQGLLQDYGRWVGLQVVSSEPPAGENVTPLIYIQEFMESAWQPRREVVAEFLLIFYKDHTVEDFVDTIVWDNEMFD